MLASWRVEKDIEGPEPSVIIGNDAPYARVVLEDGAKPHNPPIQPLLEWAARKLKKPVGSREVKRLAWGVRKKIAQQGVPPKHILSNALDEDDGFIIQNIKDELDKVL